MALELQYPFEIKIVVTDSDGTIGEVSAHFGTLCEYGNLPPKGVPITLTQNQRDTLESFISNKVIPDITP